MTKVKNISNGPRGIRLTDGSVAMLEAGQVLDDLDLADGEDEATDWFVFGKAIDKHARAEAQSADTAATAELQAALDAATTRAVAAEEERDALQDKVTELQAALDAVDRDGDGKPGGSTPADPPALAGKNKAQLLEIAVAEGVIVADDATNAAIIEAIEAKRKGA